MKAKFNINQFNPCKEAVKYYKTQPDSITAWNNCEIGDWMLWIANKLNVNLQSIILAKGYCAKLIYHLMKDKRSKNAVNMAIAFGKGKATREELNAVAYAAYNAAYDANDAATFAIYAAAYAVVYAPAYVSANPATYAAFAVSRAVPNDASDAIRISTLKKCADICRKYLTTEIMNKINEK